MSTVDGLYKYILSETGKKKVWKQTDDINEMSIMH